MHASKYFQWTYSVSFSFCINCVRQTYPVYKLFTVYSYCVGFHMCAFRTAGLWLTPCFPSHQTPSWISLRPHWDMTFISCADFYLLTPGWSLHNRSIFSLPSFGLEIRIFNLQCIKHIHYEGKKKKHHKVFVNVNWVYGDVIQVLRKLAIPLYYRPVIKGNYAE